MLSILLISSSSMVSLVLGHGSMVWPPIWQDTELTPLDERWSTTIEPSPAVRDDASGLTVGNIMVWLTDQAYLGGHGEHYKGLPGGPPATNKVGCRGKCRNLKEPWASPGIAPAFGGGCGVFGGNPFGCPAGNDPNPPGSKCMNPYRRTFNYGSSALDMEFPDATSTRWKLGSQQEVAFMTRGGHHGGYTYRLCKLPAEGKAGLTEECFTRNVLKFATDVTMNKKSGEENVDSDWEPFQQEDVSEGTFPEGSAWRRVVVSVEKKAGPLIRKDEVVVPADLPEGDYVLSWRWDISGGGQVWQSCSFVTLEV